MRKTIFSISIFIIGIITVQAKHDPNIPAILFVHGLAGAHTTWDKLVESLPAEYRYIGNYFFDQSKQVTFNRNPLEPDVIDGIFYPCFTLDFSNNQELTFHEQAQELKIIIDQKININGINKVILFGHSMGGVACRQYINDYGTEYIIGQVMVTAPNLGSGLGL
ncbi:alpha/beta fold hydrolase [bacterium]|nr:alpha/beta fold hydrolase [bacterium]